MWWYWTQQRFATSFFANEQVLFCSEDRADDRSFN
jgi:hypothetical protein